MTLNTFSWVHWTVVYHPCEMSKSYAYCLLGVLFFVLFFFPLIYWKCYPFSLELPWHLSSVGHICIGLLMKLNWFHQDNTYLLDCLILAYSLEDSPSVSFLVILSSASSFFTCMYWSVFTWTLKGNPLKISRSFFLYSYLCVCIILFST